MTAKKKTIIPVTPHGHHNIDVTPKNAALIAELKEKYCWSDFSAYVQIHFDQPIKTN